MEWNEARINSDPEILRLASNRINQAFTLNKYNPLALNLLGERAYTRKDFSKVRDNELYSILMITIGRGVV